MHEFIPVNIPSIGELEKEYVLQCLESGWISSEGPFVERFETEFSAFLGRQHGIAVSNGTAALDIAIAGLSLGPGDEVILPAFTIISCITQVVRCGATPVLVDADALTWNMDVQAIREKISERTKAIMVVHIYGLPVDLDPVLELAREFNLTVIEDSAQAHGLRYRGKLCGSFGDVSTFSFYPNKNITTGEGGMLVTDDSKLNERFRSLRNLCFRANERFVHDELGWNYRITNMQAAMGVAQLHRIEQVLIRKREIGRIYDRLLSDVPGLQRPCPVTEYAENHYWVYGLVINEDLALDAKAAIQALTQKGIGSRPFFCPMNQQPVLNKMGLFVDTNCPVAENLYRRGFYIPSGAGMTNDQLERSADIVRELMRSL